MIIRNQNFEDNITILVPSVREISPEFMKMIENRNYIILKNDINTPYVNLINECKTEYFYFLEDDDFLSKSFPRSLDLPEEYDGMYGSYLQHRDLEIDKNYKGRRITEISKEDFQIGQCIFRLSERVLKTFLRAISCPHCTMGCIHNDYFVFSNLRMLKSNKFLFVQGTNGDNISVDMERKYCKGCMYNYGF